MWIAVIVCVLVAVFSAVVTFLLMRLTAVQQELTNTQENYSWASDKSKELIHSVLDELKAANHENFLLREELARSHTSLELLLNPKSKRESLKEKAEEYLQDIVMYK